MFDRLKLKLIREDGGDKPGVRLTKAAAAKAYRPRLDIHVAKLTVA